MAFQIYNQFQHPILRVNAYDSDIEAQQGIGATTVECVIPKLDLNVGTYSIEVHLCEPPGGEVFDVIGNICPFEVVVLNNNDILGLETRGLRLFCGKQVVGSKTRPRRSLNGALPRAMPNLYRLFAPMGSRGGQIQVNQRKLHWAIT